MADVVYSNDAFVLARNTFREGEQTASVGDDRALVTAAGTAIDSTVAPHFPQLSSDCPMLDAMYGIAIRDHELVTVDPRMYFYMLCNRFTRDFKIPEGFIPEGSVFWAGMRMFSNVAQSRGSV